MSNEILHIGGLYNNLRYVIGASRVKKSVLCNCSVTKTVFIHKKYTYLVDCRFYNYLIQLSYMWTKKRKKAVYIFWFVVSIIMIVSMVGFLLLPLLYA